MENQSNIRNFAIISHIDHGKSTLADRFLEITGTVSKEKMHPQYLDMMELEQEKGITIKMQPCRMEYNFEGKQYILNLIDTPGHVDFSYEVSRSLAAVEGVILLVDATKGIQAQTLANLELARKQNLVIIPVVNKIDMIQAQTEKAKEEIFQQISVSDKEILAISAKQGTNVETLLKEVIKKIPPPKGEIHSPLRALIFDSKYDTFKGVIAYIRVIDGGIRNNEGIYLMAAKKDGKAKEVGFFCPDFFPNEELSAGEIGYVATGIKEPGKVRVGDTITKISTLQSPIPSILPLPGYSELKPVVFVSLYPENPDDFDLLKTALSKLRLSDPSFKFDLESRQALGRGFLGGFLGTLHAEIIIERIGREFNLNLIVSTPQVSHKILNQKGKEIIIKTASDWPDPTEIRSAQEPWARLEIITPINYLGQVMEILSRLRGNHIERKHLSSEKILIVFESPFKEIITGFYDQLKGVTQGYASLNYQLLDYREAKLVKLEILVGGKKEESFGRIVPESKAYEEGKKIIEKLKEVLPAQQFSVALQAAVGGKIIARETISARRKDVIAPLYGGDYTRKRKLLEKQKKGKRELKAKGALRIPQKVFLEMLRS